MIDNAIDCGTFIDDPKDVEMWQIADFLVGIKDCDDVRVHCRYSILYYWVLEDRVIVV